MTSKEPEHQKEVLDQLNDIRLEAVRLLKIGEKESVCNLSALIAAYRLGRSNPSNKDAWVKLPTPTPGEYEVMDSEGHIFHAVYDDIWYCDNIIVAYRALTGKPKEV